MRLRLPEETLELGRDVARLAAVEHAERAGELVRGGLRPVQPGCIQASVQQTPGCTFEQCQALEYDGLQLEPQFRDSAREVEVGAGAGRFAQKCHRPVVPSAAVVVVWSSRVHFAGSGLGSSSNGWAAEEEAGPAAPSSAVAVSGAVVTDLGVTFHARSPISSLTWATRAMMFLYSV